MVLQCYQQFLWTWLDCKCCYSHAPVVCVRSLASGTWCLVEIYLKTEAAHSSEMSVKIYQITRRHIPRLPPSERQILLDYVAHRHIPKSVTIHQNHGTASVNHWLRLLHLRWSSLTKCSHELCWHEQAIYWMMHSFCAVFPLGMKLFPLFMKGALTIITIGCVTLNSTRMM